MGNLYKGISDALALKKEYLEMLPFLIYAASLAYAPHAIFGLAIISAMLKRKNISWKEANNSVFGIIILIVILSSLNHFLHKFFIVDSTELIPFTVFMLGSYIIAIRLNEKDLKVFIYLVVAECLIAYIEFIIGVKTIFPDLANNVMNEDSALLYYRSVFGLSDNSSSFAIKVLLAYLLIYYLDLRGKTFVLIKVALLLGLLASFNRTSIMTVIFFHALRLGSFGITFLKQILKLKLEREIYNSLIIGITILLFGIYLTVANFDTIIEQLTRRTQSFEITGREWIWADYIDFISKNWLFGNRSEKYFLHVGEGIYHAHNSFLQTVATHGIFIGLLFFVLIIININRNNYTYVLTIVLYSVFQYGIFWGISMIDIMFLMFLMYRGFDTNTIGHIEDDLPETITCK